MEHLMRQWTAAIANSGVDHPQMDPVTGEFTLKNGANTPQLPWFTLTSAAALAVRRI